MSWPDIARVAAVVIAAPLLVSCSEGYPGEDRPIVSPFDMNNAQRVAELNVVGRDAPGVRWRYALSEGCALEVEHGSGKDKRRVAVTLTRGMDAEVVFDQATKTYDVALIDRSVEAAQPIATLFKTDGWTYATQASLLVDLLIRDCGKSPARPATRAAALAPAPVIRA